MTGPAPFTRLTPRSRADHVRDQLAAAIRRGTYPVGSKLPTERELTEMLGVSRVSVREGIRSLEAVGLVEVRHGNGCYVIEPSRRPTLDLIDWLGAHRSEVLEMLVVRGALDEVAAREAARRHDPRYIEAIRAAHAGFVAETEQAEPDLDRLAELDIAFHLSIADASRSALLIDLLGELHQHLTPARRAGFEHDGQVRRSAEEHHAILDAIAAGDEEAARRCVAHHIERVRDILRSHEQ
ncbi:FadR/GntR family transcriptional regulator [Dactylosporangium sp. CA-233914]|uniref:FadR/GntR family transcriptional regulator n=1 Tax=Dactylosporangium sp. CA-233914 TaxID=3239934 RepID=UPI003D942022